MLILINPPFVDRQTAYFQEFEAHTYANPALAILSGILYDRKIPYCVIDGKLDDLTFEQLMARIDDTLGDDEPTLIGVTNSTTTIIGDEMAMITKIKARYPNTPIVVGGPHVSALPERSLEDCAEIDIVCLFEGNETLTELYDFYSGESEFDSLADVKGIAFQTNDRKITKTSARPRSNSRWHEFKRPRWEDFSDADTYFVFTGMGCPHRCSYCYNSTDFNYSVRNPDWIMDELRYLINERNVKSFYFADATFAVNRKATLEILGRMVDEGMGEQVTWECWTRVNVADEELFAMMKKSGCVGMALGIESGVNSVLERANKKTTTDEIARAVKLTKASGITCKAFLVFGHINETIADIKETIKLIVGLNPNEVGVGVMVPWPGTEVYQLAAHGKDGLHLLTDDFKKYDKYFGESMLNDKLSESALEWLRLTCYLRLYIQNFRLIDLSEFLWSMRRPISRKLFSLIKKTFTRGGPVAVPQAQSAKD